MTFTVICRTRLNFINIQNQNKSCNFLLQRISDFLNSFDMSCRSRLSNLNEKLTEIERKVDYLEAKVSRSGETPAWFITCLCTLNSFIQPNFVPTTCLYDSWNQRTSFQARPRLVTFVPGTSYLYDIKIDWFIVTLMNASLIRNCKYSKN